MKNKKCTWGGSRKGSGRPKRKLSPVSSVNASLKLSPDSLAWLKLTAEVREVSIKDVVETLIFIALAHPEMLDMLSAKKKNKTKKRSSKLVVHGRSKENVN